MSEDAMTAPERTEVVTHLQVQIEGRNRLTTFLRPVLAVPAAILLSFLTGSALAGWSDDRMGEYGRHGDSFDSGGHWFGMVPLTVLLPAAALLLVMAFYPPWLLTFAHAVQSFDTKLSSYLFLLRDEYPTVREVPYAYVLYPDVREGAALSRGLPLVKWLLALPHYLVLAVSFLGVLAVTLVAWFAILLTGRYPARLATLPVGWIGYWNRVQGYAFTLVTDSYPRIRTGRE